MYIDNSDQEVIYFQIDSPFGQQAIVFISNAIIEETSRDRQFNLITASYDAGGGPGGRRQQIVLIVNRNTRIQDATGRQLGPNQLRRGMRIEAVVSAAFTRSLPPQTNAFIIIVNERRRPNQFAEGRIADINYRRDVLVLEEGRGGQDFPGGPGPVIPGRPGFPGGPGPVIPGFPGFPGGPGPVIPGRPGGPGGPGPERPGDRDRRRFVADRNTRIFNRNGRQISFDNLRLGARVRIEYQRVQDPDRGQINIAIVIQVI